jgi:hypothetical protein
MGTYCKYHLAQGVLSALADSEQVLIVHPKKSDKCSVEGCNRRVYFETLFYQRGSGIIFSSIQFDQHRILWGLVLGTALQTWDGTVYRE